ncbi:MAG: hypothetical protein ACM3NO_01390 [Deltaproteobacteria bacterium]
MNHARIVASLALAWVIGLAGCSNNSAPPAASEGAASNPPAAAPAAPAKPAPAAAAAKGSIWKSETTGKEYRVWTEKDQFHAEWANIPPEFAERGAHISSTGARKSGKWVGESENYLPCSEGEGKQEHIANFCQLTTGFEIDSMTDSKITGRGEALKRFDCAKCKVLEKEWKGFVWVPKK